MHFNCLHAWRTFWNFLILKLPFFYKFLRDAWRIEKYSLFLFSKVNIKDDKWRRRIQFSFQTLCYLHLTYEYWILMYINGLKLFDVRKVEIKIIYVIRSTKTQRALSKKSIKDSQKPLIYLKIDPFVFLLDFSVFYG